MYSTCAQTPLLFHYPAEFCKKILGSYDTARHYKRVFLLVLMLFWNEQENNCQSRHHHFPSSLLPAAMEKGSEGAMGIWEGKRADGVRVELLGTDGEAWTHERPGWVV